MMHYEQNRQSLIEKLKDLSINKIEKSELALDLFRFQYKYNTTYQQFAELVSKPPESVKKVLDIPFLPIHFYKNHIIKTGKWTEKLIFESSGTEGDVSSKHFVRNSSFYLDNTISGFTESYGSPENYCFLALLPSYLEKGNSSLVMMVDEFIKQSKYAQSGFYLYNYKQLIHQLLENEKYEIPTILFAVSYALLDLAEQFNSPLKHTIIIETGGMKGKRTEITKEEMHHFLKKTFKINQIHSEYGMTELFSQAYSKANGIFTSSNTMDIRIREITDPFNYVPNGSSGGINIIDYANIDTCCFIATEDLGVLYDDLRFKILGRLDKADIRGCNLLLNDLN